MLKRDDAEKSGFEQRSKLRRTALATLASRTFDPLEVLRTACRGHVAKLIPLKFERMGASPFAFFRGAVEIMAADLGASSHTGIEVQLCGDAHLKNFGFFATQSADIVLDINDFDQTQRGPWEWDVKRMATSIMLAGRIAGDGEAGAKAATRIFLHAYIEWMRQFAQMPSLEVARHRAVRDSRDRVIRAALGQAERSTPESNLKKLTKLSHSGSFRFVHKLNLLWEVTGSEKKHVLNALASYRQTLSPEHRLLFDRYLPQDVGFKVVGTGSVGTRDYAVLLFGRDEKDPLFLQIKEELPSAYTGYYKDPTLPAHQGERVVRGQRIIQVFSDQLLGWCSIQGRDYLVRQLSDHKSSIEPENLGGRRLAEYSRVCAELLAKGHARSGEPAMLASYLGRSDKAERALLKFAVMYADRTEKDFQMFKKALKRGFSKSVSRSI
jgi:uncharacterized protein (DUF2252 family)